MFVYADHAATTPLSPAAMETMVSMLGEQYGNPGSVHPAGRRARKALAEARETVAGCLGASPDEIYFTAGGTEGNNWAILSGARLAGAAGKRHIISDGIEHPSVLEPLKALEAQGFEVTYLPVGAEGRIDPAQLEAALRPDTGLVSIMYSNNETGVVQPVGEIGALCRSRGVLFHTDAVQAAGHIPIDVEREQIDLLTLSGHKFYAPKGVGALYCRRGITLPPLILGGGQERGLRSGTENVPALAAMATALRDCTDRLEPRMRAVSAMRYRLIEGLSQIPGAHENGSRSCRAPGVVSFCFEGVEGESLLLRLNMAGICASSGSACASGTGRPSHVLLAMGVSPELARGALRLSLSERNTPEEVDYLLEVIPREVEGLRRALRD